MDKDTLNCLINPISIYLVAQWVAPCAVLYQKGFKVVLCFPSVGENSCAGAYTRVAGAGCKIQAGAAPCIVSHLTNNHLQQRPLERVGAVALRARPKKILFLNGGVSTGHGTPAYVVPGAPLTMPIRVYGVGVGTTARTIGFRLGRLLWFISHTIRGDNLV